MKKGQVSCQIGANVLSRLRKEDDTSGEEDRAISETAKPQFIQSTSKSGQATTTEAKGKQGSSNNRGKKKAASYQRGCGGWQDNTARPDRPYCTQGCLLGLIRGHILDTSCPNIQAHQKSVPYYNSNTSNGRYNRYPSHDGPPKSASSRSGGFGAAYGSTASEARKGWQWRIQVAWTVWLGWSSVSPWTTLIWLYIRVAEGTVQPLVPVLRFEASMYKRMENIQGNAIPVYLGSVDLTSTFHLITGAAIVHLMLLSWGGEEAWRSRRGLGWR